MSTTQTTHQKSHGSDKVPRPAILAAGAVIAATILLVLAVRTGNLNSFSVPTTTKMTSLSFTVEDGADGQVMLRNGSNGTLVAEIATGQENFIRGVLRGFARERRLNNVGAKPAFELTRWSDDRLTIRDTATGRLIDLGGFGIDNASAFARLLRRTEGA
jgi:putative photosynthetic complex assembly protein